MAIHHGLRRRLSLWRPVRAAVILSVYLAGVAALAFVWAVAPAHALVSSTGYARVVHQAELIAAVAARKATVASAVAASAMAASPASVALRVVAGPIGWGSLGVTAGLMLAQVYYSASDVTAIKTAATPPGGDQISHPTLGTWTVPSVVYNSQQAHVNYSIVAPCIDGNQYDWMVGPYPQYDLSFYNGPSGLGAVRPAAGGYWICHFAGQPGTATPQSGQVTEQDIVNYVNGLPESDPKSVESHTQGLGTEGQPTAAGNVTTESVNASELPSQVVPVANVQSTDTVVNPDAPVPQGTETTQTATQQSTRTTTTTTNPDGSVTEQTEEQATFSCTAGSHDARTFASIWLEHQAAWSAAPLFAQLTALKSLVWPSTLPVVSLPSTLFGNFSVDFAAWSAQFAAVRLILLGVVSIAAVRLVFAGRGGE